MKDVLLGYYISDGNITAATGESPYFIDKSQSSRMIAKIVPLQFKETQSEWLTIPNLYDIPSDLKLMFEKRQLFSTMVDDNTTESSNYAVLMHVIESELDMARTGLLLRKSNSLTTWEPVTVTYQGHSYFVECKGVGSPMGGYVSFHQRTQAGTSKTHTRVTGGMLKASMEKEFENLMTFQSFHQFSIPGVLPLACIGFDFFADETPLSMGLLLRLTRSNIRYSYEDFGQFDIAKPNLYSMFSQENNALFSVGLRHQNLTANNLVYFSDDHYVVTDYEELSSIYQAPVSLDSDSSSVPLFLKIFPFRFLYRDLYTTNESSFFFKNELALNEIQSSFQSSRSILMDYIISTQDFMLPNYRDVSLPDWINSSLLVNLELQKSIISEWIDQLKVSDSFDFNQFIIPYVKQLHLSRKDKDFDIQRFYHRTKMSIMFIFPDDDPLYKLQLRLKHLNKLIRQLNFILEKRTYFSIQSTYQTPFLYISDDIDYWDATLLLFPFLQWVSHWVDFLKRHYGNYTHVSQLIHRLEQELKCPEQLYTIFKSSSDEFLDFITQP